MMDPGRKQGQPCDEDVLIIDDDSDDEPGDQSNDTGSELLSPSAQGDDISSCKNPEHAAWGNNDTNYKWQAQVPMVAMQVFRHLGYERKTGSRCKFCETCVNRAQSLTEKELKELVKFSKINAHTHARRMSEMATIKAQMEKLDKLDISDEERALQAKQLRMLAFVNPGKFMEDFDPETSTREMKKMNRRINKEKQYSLWAKKNTLYDGEGVLITGGQDLCDCLDMACPGCHFPCPKCGSEKCGAECRCNRRWTYEYVESEGHGKDNTVVWPFTT